MHELTLEERGAYNTILDMIYDGGGPIRDQERLLCAHLNCDPRVWRRIKKTLIERGKITLSDDGWISNERAISELTRAIDTANVRRSSGARGGKQTAKTRQKDKENQPNDEANASANASANSQQISEARGRRDVPTEQIPSTEQPSGRKRAEVALPPGCSKVDGALRHQFVRERDDDWAWEHIDTAGWMQATSTIVAASDASAEAIAAVEFVKAVGIQVTGPTKPALTVINGGAR